MDDDDEWEEEVRDKDCTNVYVAMALAIAPCANRSVFIYCVAHILTRFHAAFVFVLFFEPNVPHC